MAQAPPSEPIGTRDIDSTPPAKTRSSHPDATFCAATLTASRPEAQKRLSWTPATVSGSPALIAAVLAMSAPWSPTGETQPSTTSSTRFGSSRSLRTSISCIRPTTRSTGLTACSEPLLLPLPRGVRMASNTNASVAAIPQAPRVESGRRTVPQETFMHERKFRPLPCPCDGRHRQHPSPPQPGAAQRRDADRAARRDARQPRPGRLRQHDHGARLRARGPVARRAPPPLPDARRAARRGDRVPRRPPRGGAAGGGGRAAHGGRARGAGARLLFDSYAHPLYQATLDLWTHARTDPDLRQHLVPIERAFDRQTIELARTVFPDAARRPDFEGLMELSVATIRGLVVLDTLQPRGRRARRQWPFCRERLVALLEAG